MPPTFEGWYKPHQRWNGWYAPYLMRRHTTRFVPTMAMKTNTKESINDLKEFMDKETNKSFILYLWKVSYMILVLAFMLG